MPSIGYLSIRSTPSALSPGSLTGRKAEKYWKGKNDFGTVEVDRQLWCALLAGNQ